MRDGAQGAWEKRGSAGEGIQYFAGAGEIGEAFFFGAKFRGVGEKGAAGAAGGMLDVEHFVVEDVLDGELGDVGAIHAAVEEDLVGAGVEAAELAAPGAGAPADVGALELIGKIFGVEVVEELMQVKVFALRIDRSGANAAAAHASDAMAGAVGAGVVEIGGEEFFAAASAIV
jgi:hypothetical protein